VIKRSEGYFKGHDDFELFYQTWTPQRVRGTLVVTHGLGEHSECYVRLAEGLAGTEWEIFAWDLRGHGRSEGKRGVIREFDDFSRDLSVFVDHVQHVRPRKPLVVLGHSMGGLITIRMLETTADKGIKAMALSSPQLGIAVKVSKIKEVAAHYLNKYLPDLTLYNEIAYGDLTKDKEVQAEYARDSLRHDRISSGLYVQMLGAMEKARGQASAIWLPTLLQQAGDDTIVNRPMAEQFFEKLGSVNKRIIVYEDYKHEIFNELGRKKVFQDLAEWLEPFLDG
jgi:alpha-beta hydrolase superfamily lysophospholipase